VLDVCTGTADLAIAARTATPGAARVVGVDFAGAMLELGRDKIANAGLAPDVTLVRGDAVRIPLADSSVDAVTVAFGIRNVEDVPVACREMHRVLKRGGALAILEFAIPTVPILRTAYLMYFRHILPAIGRLVSRHSAAYEYLPNSVGAFATPDQLMGTLRACGFVDVAAVRMTFGIVFLYTARRGS
jgi:demethylmenaquinone methyltransferase/2-methoxy-6-polyprenyl-1,4-benzoquinol methylase